MGASMTGHLTAAPDHSLAEKLHSISQLYQTVESEDEDAELTSFPAHLNTDGAGEPPSSGDEVYIYNVK